MTASVIFAMKKIFILLLSVLVFLTCFGCQSNRSATPPDGTAESPSSAPLPVIRSSDKVMPLYLDISLFNEENYSSVLLKKTVPSAIVYAEETLTVPTDLATLAAQGFFPDPAVSIADTVKAGDRLTVPFKNSAGRYIEALFYNPLSVSVPLPKCMITELLVRENYVVTKNPAFGNFEIQRIHNRSAITDVITYLGTPSHFHDEHDGIYSLDYYFTEKDHRNKITVWINTTEDCITAVSVADYR